jgi:hypothetical protein
MPSNVEKYKALGDLLEQLPVFYQPWWLDTVSNNWDVSLAGKKEQIEAVWPYSFEKIGFFKIVRNPLLTPYLGPYFLPPNIGLSNFKRLNREEELFEELWDQLPGYDSCSVDTHPSFKNFLLLRHKGLSNTNRITYHINLHQGLQQIMDQMQSSHRKRMQQASQIYSLNEGADYIPFLEKLHRETFSRKGKSYIYPEGFLNKLINRAYQHKQGSLMAAINEFGDVHACIFTLYDRHAMYLLLSATDTERAHKGAVCFLICEAIKRAQQLGLDIFDFEGSMDPGIEPFFRRFGGERAYFMSFEQHRSVLWKLKRRFLG